MTEVASSKAAIVVLTAAVLFLLFRHILFANSAVFVVCQVLAASLMLWARLTFGRRSFHGAANPTAGGLVIRGPYRYIRHPIYSAILLFVWSGIGDHLSLESVGAGLIATVTTAIRIRAEERLLMVRYPEYAAYAARTKRVIPLIY